MIHLFALLVGSLFAYIPEYSMIASRAAEQHGKGAYQIDQDVIIRREAEVFSVRESWLVNNETSMRVTLEGRGPLKGLVSGAIIYDGNVKIFYDGSVRQQRLSDEWLEPLFHFRSAKFFRDRLAHLKVAPPASLRDRNPLPSDGDIRYEPPSFMRMSRVGGALAWAIGLNPNSGETPTLWLEQDQFVLRKYKNLNKAVVRADEYVRYHESFWYPRSRTYQFGPITVQIQTIRVQPTTAKIGDGRFRSGSLAANKEILRLPDMEGLRDFYQRFR